MPVKEIIFWYIIPLFDASQTKVFYPRFLNTWFKIDKKCQICSKITVHLYVKQ